MCLLKYEDNNLLYMYTLVLRRDMTDLSCLLFKVQDDTRALTSPTQPLHHTLVVCKAEMEEGIQSHLADPLNLLHPLFTYLSRPCLEDSEGVEWLVGF